MKISEFTVFEGEIVMYIPRFFQFLLPVKGENDIFKNKDKNNWYMLFQYFFPFSVP